MNTKIETITPERAKQMIEDHLLRNGTQFDPLKKYHASGQRPYDPGKAQHFARLMACGQFGITHQGVAIDSDGFMIDGQHRLGGVAISGKEAQMNVSWDVPVNQNGVFTFDMIDRGSTRTVGQQLAKHGAGDYNRLAAAARCILSLAATAYHITIRKSEVGDVLHVIDHYRAELDAAMHYRATLNGLRSAHVTGALAFALKVGDGRALRLFAEKYITGVGCESGEPALTVRNWLLANYKSLPSGGAAHASIARVVLTGCMYAEQQNALKMVKVSDAGYVYFMGKQRRTITALLAECGYMAG